MKKEIKKQDFKSTEAALKMRISNILKMGGMYMQNKDEIISELIKLVAENDTLENAKNWARKEFVENPTICPLCNQQIFMQKRKLNSGMAAFLWGAYKITGGDITKVFHYQDVMELIKLHNGDYANLYHWGLIAPIEGKKTGNWTLTEKAILFIEGKINVPEKLFVYNSKSWGFSPEEISFKDSISDKFDLDEFMKDGTFIPFKAKSVI